MYVKVCVYSLEIINIDTAVTCTQVKCLVDRAHVIGMQYGITYYFAQTLHYIYYYYYIPFTMTLLLLHITITPALNCIIIVGKEINETAHSLACGQECIANCLSYIVVNQPTKLVQ